MKLKTILYTLLIGVLFISACKEEDPITPSAIDPSRKGNLMLEFESQVNGLTLLLNTQTYINELNQEFKITKFAYFISNISLLNEDGTTYTVPKDSSYFLITAADQSSSKITLKNIPEGNYKGINFTIGIDSATNHLPVEQRTGVINPVGSDMYWSWNSGYIHLKMEGTSVDAPIDTVSGTRPLQYHIGGFGYNGAINNVRTASIAFTSGIADVRAAHEDEGPEVHMIANVAKIFTGTGNVDFSQRPVVMGGAFSSVIADNYAKMFSFGHIHNHTH